MIFVPEPSEVAKLDDDIACMVWRREVSGIEKILRLSLTCYGDIQFVRCTSKRKGVVNLSSFEKAWEWYCSDNIDLPNND